MRRLRKGTGQKTETMLSEEILRSINESNDFSDIGVAHNEMVDILMKEQESLLRNGKEASEKEIYDSVRSRIYKLLSTHDFSKISLRSNDGGEISESEFNDLYDDVVLEISTKSPDDIRFYTEKDLEILSQEQADLLDELDTIMADDDVSIESILTRISAVQEKAKKTLKKEELDVILPTISVAANTCAYWSSCFSGSHLRVNFDWKKVGRADIAAGLGITVAVAIRVAIAGPIGWKLAAGLIVGGAVGGSVTNAANQLQ